MATRAQIVSALERAGIDYHSDALTLYGHDQAQALRAGDGIVYDGRITGCNLRGSMTWDHDDMRRVAVALRTEHIDVTGGCETCGYGSTLYVRDIPHPFPCLECHDNIAREEDPFCSDEHAAAWTVRDALTKKGWDHGS